MNNIRLALATQLLACALASGNALGFESVREQEIKQCLPGEIATWGDGTDRKAQSSPLIFQYSHAQAPAWFAQTEILAAVRRAAGAWSSCGVMAQVVDPLPASAAQQGIIRIQWHEQDSGGNFGLANLGQRKLSLSPSAFAMLKERNPRHDARETLQMVISHEMGHFWGLMAHSRRCIDVTSYYNNDKGESCFARDISLLHTVPEYRSVLPTACDIERCKMANGISSRTPTSGKTP